MTDTMGKTLYLRPSGANSAGRRFLRQRSGAAAIEFAILLVPFLLVLFASIETAIAFAGEQLLANATETMARKLRTGEITAATSQSDFRRQFCAEIAAIMTCSPAEIDTPDKLYLDVRSFSNFTDIPTAVPRVGNAPAGDLDTSSFRYAPGASGTINIVRAYYRWHVTTDLVRPYITNLRPAGGGHPKDYLMVATAAFRAEAY
ncbi:TadE/TadG family type IV pilus assembly protein [Xaviernesmea oryzae]|nr:TadE/TadG family type IV pilus assembly protein [Xaviernesmea oryzae]SEL94239.1 Flp pilus assembly protein TadG [Xaviernesmea oryzae]